jgi:hypothetical protein
MTSAVVSEGKCTSIQKAAYNSPAVIFSLELTVRKMLDFSGENSDSIEEGQDEEIFDLSGNVVPSSQGKSTKDDSNADVEGDPLPEHLCEASM